MPRILVIPDLHEPATHPAARDFVDSIAQEYQPDSVVFIGDVVDHHCVSFHTRQFEAPNPLEEYKAAKQGVQKWYQQYPEAMIMIGNHDCRPLRLAVSVGLPAEYLKDFSEVWDTPGWTWVPELVIGTGDNSVYFTHGTGRSGINPAANMAKDLTMSAVMGHAHSTAGIKWFSNPNKRWFGLDVGSLIDGRGYAFAYNRSFKKSVLGLGVVDTDNPMDTGFIPMPCSPGEQFSREQYPANPLLRTL